MGHHQAQKSGDRRATRQDFHQAHSRIDHRRPSRRRDPDTNPRLRTAILAAKGENMPNDNIERAIQRGTGTLEGETLDEVMFEGYGPGGVGVLVQVVTSNRNRIVSEIRHMFSKNGGNMAENGAVGWMFHRKGDIVVAQGFGRRRQDDEHRARRWRGRFEGRRLVLGSDHAARNHGESARGAGLDRNQSRFRRSRLAAAKLCEARWPQAQQMLRMVEALEDHDDVQHVYANFDIDEKEIQAAVVARRACCLSTANRPDTPFRAGEVLALA